MIKRYNVVTKKTYTSKGEEKSSWNNVGTLVHFPATDEKEEGFKLELSMFPATQFYVFEAKPKENRPTETKKTPENSEEEISVDQIPF